MDKEGLCRRCSIRFHHTESFSLPALSGSPASCSPSLISVGRKCSAFCNSWLLSPLDDDGPIALLVRHVRFRLTGVFALCKDRLRGQSASSSQLDDVWHLHRGTSSIWWTLLDRV